MEKVFNEKQRFDAPETAEKLFLMNKKGRLEEVTSEIYEAVKAGTNKDFIMLNDNLRYEMPVVEESEEDPEVGA